MSDGREINSDASVYLDSQDIKQDSLYFGCEATRSLRNIPTNLESVSVQAINSSVYYICNTNTNFSDSVTFASSRAKLLEEAQHHSELNNLLDQGRDFTILLYTWRTISACFVMPKSNTDPDRNEIYSSVYKILHPCITQLIAFKSFTEMAIEQFSKEVKRLSLIDRNSDFISESYFITLGKLLRMFALLDRIKLMSSAIHNDLSYYRRAYQYFSSKNISDETPSVELISMIELDELSRYFSDRGKITASIRSKVHKIKNYEEILSDIINACITIYESRRYIMPDEKHRLVLSIAFALTVIENQASCENPKEAVTISKLTKRIKFEKIDRIFKECKTINMYGDIFIDPFDYIKETASYSTDQKSRWTECLSSKSSSQGAILQQMPMLREEYLQLVNELAIQRNMLSSEFSDTVNKKEQIQYEKKVLSDTALKALIQISRWTLAVIETYTWKLANPVPEINYKHLNITESDGHYSKVTKFNYSSEEKILLVELIGMIKSAQSMMQNYEKYYIEAINRTLYFQLQFFINNFLLSLLEKTKKKNKKNSEIFIRMIETILMCCNDTLDQVDFNPTYGTISKSSISIGTIKRKADEKKRVQNEKAYSLINAAIENQRSVGPSSTQLYMLRAVLEIMLDKKSTKKSLFKDELDKDTLYTISSFYNMTFFWPYLLNYSEMMQQSGDLSQLWFREFFINMDLGCIQFPIEMSIPWILIDEMLNCEDTSQLENVLYTLDLYNDAAQCALYKFHKQHLYDEIEAETCLIFEQISFKLANLIFKHFKVRASYIYLDKRFYNECRKLAPILVHPPIKSVQSDCYVTLLQQRDIHILGRNVDLNNLIAVKMNKKLVDSLQSAFGEFLSTGFSGIIELETAIEINRLCHKLLEEHMDLEKFDDLLFEACFRLVPKKDTYLMLFVDSLDQIATSWLYNTTTRRFVSSYAPTKKRNESGGNEMSSAVKNELINDWCPELYYSYEAILTLFANFAGDQHFVALFNLLKYTGVSSLLDKILTEFYLKLNDLYGVCIELCKFMPNCDKTSKSDFIFTSQGQFGSNSYKLYCAFVEELKSLFDTEQKVALLTLFSQLVTKLGNIVIIFYLVEKAMQIEGCFSRTKRSLCNQVESSEKASLTSKLSVLPAFVSHASQEQTSVLDSHTVPITCDNLSKYTIFPCIIKSLSEATYVSLGQLFPEFHRLFTAVQFYFYACHPGQIPEKAFGDGFEWGGVCLIYLLNQSLKSELLNVSTSLIQAHLYDTTTDRNQIHAPIRGINLSLVRIVARLNRLNALTNQIRQILDNLGHEEQQTESPSSELIYEDIYGMSNSGSRQIVLINPPQFIPPGTEVGNSTNF